MATLDWTLQQYLDPSTLDRVSGVVAGHMHWLEVLAFENEDLPVQLVVGHGGTKVCLFIYLFCFEKEMYPLN